MHMCVVSLRGNDLTKEGFSRIRIRSHLYESVLRFESCAVSGRAGVQSSNVLTRSGPLAVEIKAVTRLSPHQVTQPRQKLRRVQGRGFR